MRDGFVYLDDALPGIFWDAKYASADNFTGSIVDGYEISRVVGTQELAGALQKALTLARQQGLSLLLWDGYRPQRAVDCFLRWAHSPEDGRTKERFYPNIKKTELVPLGYIAPKSGHSRGSAIDLTLCDPETGTLLDMGGYFDRMDLRSHHGSEDVPQKSARNRKLLRAIMEACGFSAYEPEWWHYSLKSEPYPESYFDFPIA